MNIVIIPARGRSKRIKNNNIKLFNRKLIINYVIIEATKSKIFNSFIVSTDDNKIASIINKYAA